MNSIKKFQKFAIAVILLLFATIGAQILLLYPACSIRMNRALYLEYQSFHEMQKK